MIFVKEDKGVNIGLQQDNFEYRQSANTLFNFMPKLEYLLDNLRQMKMYPRYVEENVEFLNLTYGNSTFAAQNRQVHLNIIGQTRKPLL